MNRWVTCIAGLVLTFSTVGCCYRAGYYDPVTGCAPGGHWDCSTCLGPNSSCGPVCDTGYRGSGCGNAGYPYGSGGCYAGYPYGHGCLLVDGLHSLHSALFCGWSACHGGYGWGAGGGGCYSGGSYSGGSYSGGCYDGCGFAPGCGTPGYGCSPCQPGGIPGLIQQPAIAPLNGLSAPAGTTPGDPSSLYQGPTVPRASYGDPLELLAPSGGTLHDARNRRWIPARL